MTDTSKDLDLLALPFPLLFCRHINPLLWKVLAKRRVKSKHMHKILFLPWENWVFRRVWPGDVDLNEQVGWQMFADGAMDQLRTSTRIVDISWQEAVPWGWPCPTMGHISGTSSATRSPLLSHCCPCCTNGIARTVTSTKKCILGRAECCAELRLGKTVVFKEKNICLNFLRSQSATLWHIKNEKVSLGKVSNSSFHH